MLNRCAQLEWTSGTARFAPMKSFEPFDKGVIWRTRAAELRRCAAAAEDATVRRHLLAMAETFECYAVKWASTIRSYRFAPAPPAAEGGRQRRA
jgi:hypothetical protein